MSQWPKRACLIGRSVIRGCYTKPKGLNRNLTSRGDGMSIKGAVTGSVECVGAVGQVAYPAPMQVGLHDQRPLLCSTDIEPPSFVLSRPASSSQINREENTDQRIPSQPAVALGLFDPF
jgi:hypothetical protein